MNLDVPSEVFRISNGDDFVDFRVYSMNSGFIRVDVKVSSFGFSGAQEVSFSLEQFENFARGLADLAVHEHAQVKIALRDDFELHILSTVVDNELIAKGCLSYGAICYDAQFGEYTLTNKLEFAFELTLNQLVDAFRSSWLMKYAEARH